MPLLVELDQFKVTLAAQEQPLQEVKAALDLAGKKNRIAELEKTMEEPSFWEDADKATRTMQELKNLKATVETCEGLETKYDDIQTLIEMAYEENDESLVEEIGESLEEFAE